MLMQCLTLVEASKVLEEFHEGLVRGHYGSETKMKKIMLTCYSWSTIHKDVVDLCQKCDIFQ
jgi:hypothetical protein